MPEITSMPRMTPDEIAKRAVEVAMLNVFLANAIEPPPGMEKKLITWDSLAAEEQVEMLLMAINAVRDIEKRIFVDVSVKS